jgi:hypothetical protein
MHAWLSAAITSRRRSCGSRQEIQRALIHSLSASDGLVDASLLWSARQFGTQLQMIQTQVEVAE